MRIPGLMLIPLYHMPWNLMGTCHGDLLLYNLGGDFVFLCFIVFLMIFLH
jgi:hypothetical protein